jgi:hypothetical protein
MQYPPTSWKLPYSEPAVSPLEMRHLTFLEHNKSKGGVLGTHVMTSIHKNAVKNAV